MFDPAQLAALSAVHRRGSFEHAAAELHVTPSAISQRIKALEEAAGTLLIRRGQPCSATETGRRLVRHHDEIALLTKTLAEDLESPFASAVLRIAINADSLATWVMPALAAVHGFLYDVIIDDQGFSQDLLKSGEVEGAITSHPGPLQGCDTVALGALRYRATASPAFVERWFPGGITARSLATAPALRFNDKDRLQTVWASRFGPVISLPSHRIASSHGFVDACLAGIGWGLNPQAMVKQHLASGALVDLGPASPLDLPLYWQFNRLTSRATAPLTRALQQAAQAL